MIRLIIDGTDQTENSDLSSVSTIIGLNTSTETFNLESSGLSINLRNEAAQQIKELFIDDCPWPPNVINASIITDYGNFEFTILPFNVSWCDDCTATIILSNANNEELCYNRFNNTPVLNDDLWEYMITKNKWKLVPYSNDTTVFALAAIQLLNIITLLPNLLIWNKEVKLVQQWSLYSTGRWHAALKVTDILEYYAEKCGRVFRSTILQSDPYNRMYVLPAANAPGAFYLKGTRDMTLERSDKYNMGELTVVNFLDILNDLFFAEWRINATEVILEPAEIIKDSAVNVGVLDARERICIDPIKYNCAKASFTYALDYTDAAGDVERDAYVYTHDYQIDNRALTELCKVSIPFSVATNTRGRHAVDGVSAFREPGAAPLGEFNDFMGIELALSKNASALPKLLINRQFEEDSQAYLIQERYKVPGTDNQYISNPQISFDPEVPGNLYDYRHYKRDPSEGVLPCKEIQSIEVCFSQTLLSAMRTAFAAGKTCYVTSDYGNLYFTSAEVVFGIGQRIVLQNIKIYN